ncbi:SH3 domain-containing protein [Streptomyces sp. SID14478]|uniref:SH3 domain-containing protein n=1 Tax=Streptomyces sp. SID14478 TaxID=2706073 RepID=UPI0013E080A4|nr:SH3 domain-containing protein [Streptomyces sp. SID14478]NEB80681.1 SH3 domain-containing protein [Streptomyces sp. SID14478]
MNRHMVRNAVVAAVAAVAMFPAAAMASAPATSHPTGHHHSVHGRVVTPHHIALKVRSGPGTGYRVLGTVRSGSVQALACKKHGSSVRGNSRWYKLSHRKGYVSAGYVTPFRSVPWC